ncbi:nuclear transport factor 2 family protein [Rhodococcus sp. T2V]|uniref:nuclear transport factor 2 family protein n=1 Tax=Rhodococcus sp. T2V TaxID=3034164 RepID=UPI0023E2E238|nr:nuclear transport factor 2 family protein [Rhodococcus sp. T2V]MDF3309656.1 nuclear transport factor 2 family protein [Rhodococcus sp. T2V]
MSTTDDLQDYLDRAAIEAVLVRYVNSNGRDDFDAMAECFTVDGGMGDGPPAGRDGLRERFASIRSRSLPLWQVDAIHRTQHLLTNVEIHLRGDEATSFCGAFTTIVATRDNQDIVVQRGITYTDDFVRTPEGWRIRKRIHDLKWETEGDLVTRHVYS